MRIGALFEHNIDFKRRSIYLTGDVDDSMYETVTKGLHLLLDQGTSPIMIYLNTGGGDLYNGLAIYNLIKNCPAPVDVCCIGAAFSAGSVILQAGRTRYITHGSYVMVHYGTESNDSAAVAHHHKAMSQKMKEIYKTNAKVSKRTINGWFTKDTYYEAEKAKSVGLVDEVVKWK